MSRQLSREAERILDTLGSFFVSTYNGKLYKMAISDVKNGKEISLTASYVSIVSNYIKAVEHDHKVCKSTITDLFDYYQKHHNTHIMTLAEFEDRVLFHFIPREFLNVMVGSDRDRALAEIIIHGAVTLGRKLLHDGISSMVDDHGDRVFITDLQNFMVEVFAKKREEYHDRFAKAAAKKQQMPEDIVDKLKTRLVAETRAKIELETELESYKRVLGETITQWKAAAADLERLRVELATPVPTHNDEEVLSLKRNVMSLRQQLNAEKIRVNNLERELAAARSTPASPQPTILKTSQPPESEPQMNIAQFGDDPWNKTSSASGEDMPGW